MQKIPLLLAREGMTLARDVFRGNASTGMPICGKGHELTTSLIERFDKLEVQAVYVEGHPVWEEGSDSLDKMLCALDDRFIKTIHKPQNAMLHAIYKAYLIKSMRGDCDRQAE